ncbi:GcrA family cell cycle regulator [Shinella daejeonensis]|uniref:GcrA family cell cycle regulator n=1 Tax=Shinella daejeonensis TaxID=659017 RepID=UPI0020C75A2F|nr:GcrA family cell cycle regulator [Shinella daejeonensis]MCP8896310.1 GcrA family cell cycle regulator [Shinella daejeonensis]
MSWTDERVERLTKLWSEGLSASQIAAQLGGVSRNAVIGKVHRLNLPGRVKAGGSQVSSRPKRTPPAPARPAGFSARPASPRPAARPAAAREESETSLTIASEQLPVAANANAVVVPMSRKLELTQLTERTCKWPIGDPLNEDFHFCGNESPDNSPYCTYHQRLAYQPSGERRRAR